LAWNSTCFGEFVYPTLGVYSLYTQQWYMSCRFVDSFRAGPGWNSVPSWSCSKTVWHIPLLSVQWINSWWLTDELSETRRVSCQNKFVKLVHVVGFIIKKCVEKLNYVLKSFYVIFYWSTRGAGRCRWESCRGRGND